MLLSAPNANVQQSRGYGPFNFEPEAFAETIDFDEWLSSEAIDLYFMSLSNSCKDEGEKDQFSNVFYHRPEHIEWNEDGSAKSMEGGGIQECMCNMFATLEFGGRKSTLMSSFFYPAQSSFCARNKPFDEDKLEKIQDFCYKIDFSNPVCLPLPATKDGGHWIFAVFKPDNDSDRIDLYMIDPYGEQNSRLHNHNYLLLQWHAHMRNLQNLSHKKADYTIHYSIPNLPLQPENDRKSCGPLVVAYLHQFMTTGRFPSEVTDFEFSKKNVQKIRDFIAHTLLPNIETIHKHVNTLWQEWRQEG